MSVLNDYSLSSGANTFSHPCGSAELPDTIYESRLTSIKLPNDVTRSEA